MVINKQSMRENNVRSVLRAIVSHGPISRSDIARELSLNKVTVSDILTELLEKEYVCEIGQGKSTRSGGRKPLMLEFNKNYGYFITAEIGSDYVNIMSTYANGNINRFTELSFDFSDIDELILLVDKEIPLFKVEKTLHGLLGISFELHDIVYENNVFTDSDLSASAGAKKLCDFFSHKYQIPVILENEAKAAAIYQRDFSTRKNCSNLISLSIHEGISAGIIINDSLYRGTMGMAGNLNRIIMIDPREKEYVPISELCSQVAVIKKIGISSGLSVQALQQISQLYAQKDAHVIDVLNSFTNNIAISLNNLIANFAPQVIVFNSTLLENIPSLLIDIRKKVEALGNQHTELIISNDSKYSSLLGGYSIIMRQVFHLGKGRLCLIS